MDSIVSTNPSRGPPARDHSTEWVIRGLAWRYGFVLVAVAGLVVLDQIVVQQMLQRVHAFAPVINMAGRQRMLSQRLVKAARALRESPDEADAARHRDELRSSLAQSTAEHEALVKGDSGPGIRPIHTPEIDDAWMSLAPHFEAMVTAARHILDGADGPRSSAEILIASTATLVQHEARFLPLMDGIVKLFEEEAAHAIFQFRASTLGISALVIALLIGLGWSVVRPATRTIRSQFEELEDRVTLRTRELAAALQSLRQAAREQEEADQRNKRLAAELTHAERVSTMGQLTGGLAHELNQPLAAITNYTETCELLLANAPLDGIGEQARDLLEKAKRSALRAGQIVRRMRNFVRPTTTFHEACSLHGLVVEIIDLCRPEGNAAAIDLRFQAGANDDAVLGDAIQIQQVLVNLVQNAVQAISSDGSDRRTISISTTNVDDDVRVDVADSGPGFASVGPDAVFTAFHSTKPDGLGIGLSICRSIVEAHRGRIWIESCHSGGHVAFTIPLAVEHASRADTRSDCLCG